MNPPQAKLEGIRFPVYVKQALEHSGIFDLRDQNGWISNFTNLDYANAVAAMMNASAPQEFPAPPEGESWHNPANLTPEQVGINEGRRLLLVGEQIDEADESFFGGEWNSTTMDGRHVGPKDTESKTHGFNYGLTMRTLRPLPQPKKRVPLDRSDFPTNFWLELSDDLQSDFHTSALTVGDTGVRAIDSDGDIHFYTYAYLFARDAKYSSDRITWKPCSKLVEVAK